MQSTKYNLVLGVSGCVCALVSNINVFHAVGQGQEFENAALTAASTQQVCNGLLINF